MNIPRITMTKNLDNFENVTKVYMSSFVSLFTKLDIVTEVGYPIKEFFIWKDIRPKFLFHRLCSLQSQKDSFHLFFAKSQT